MTLNKTKNEGRNEAEVEEKGYAEKVQRIQ